MPIIYIQIKKVFLFLPLVTHTTNECPNTSLCPKREGGGKKEKYNTEKLTSMFSSLYIGCYF